jgi:glycosyltransferase involved in cell wall biosynthesis
VHNYFSRRSLWGTLKEVVLVRKKIRDENITLVHAQFGSSTAFLALLSGTKFIITFRGSDLNVLRNNFFRSRIVLLISNFCAFFASAVISVSEELSGNLIFKKNLLILPSGTDTDRYVPIDKAEARKKLHLEKGPYIAFASGGRRPLKRYDLAVKIIQSLNDRGIPAELLELTQIPDEDMPVYINASDCLILLSDSEGSPNIVREALSCGVPVVSFDVGDVKKWISKDKISKVVVPRDTSIIAAEVEKILNSTIPRKRRLDVSTFSLTGTVEKISLLYKSIK